MYNAIDNVVCLKNKKKNVKNKHAITVYVCNITVYVCKCILLGLVFQYKLSMALNHNLRAGGQVR